MNSRFNEIQKFHQLQLQLSSEGLLELYTWLHDNKQGSNTAVNELRSTILATILANLDTCKKPYVAAGDLVIPVSQDRLEKMTFGGQYDMGTSKSSPSDYLKNPGECPATFDDPTLDGVEYSSKTGWDPIGGRPINPDVAGAAAMSDDADEENAAESAAFDELNV